MQTYDGFVSGGRGGSLGLSDFFRAFRKRRLLAFLTFCAIFAITFGIASQITPTYDASAVLLVGNSADDRRNETSAQISDTTVSLAEIGGSEEVVGDAITRVGLARLMPPEKDAPQAKSIAMELFSRVASIFYAYAPSVSKDFLKPSEALPDRPTTALEHAIPSIRKRLTVKAEPNSDIINISFRHTDPIVAADFVNAVAAAFIDRQLNISTRTGAVDFYWKQAKAFGDAVEKDSRELNSFTVTNGVYDIDSQRQLLLTRLNGLSTELFATRSAIASKEAVKNELIEQLHKLTPVAKSEYVSGLVDSFADSKRKNVGDFQPEQRGPVKDPPLLMIKVFQDSMALLFQLKADLKGLEGLEEEQNRQVSALAAELTNLSKKQAAFMELKQLVASDIQNEMKYKDRAIEEDVSAKAIEAKLTTLKVVQKATYPIKSNLPDKLTIGLIGLIGGLLGALSTVLAAEFIFSGNQRQPQQPQWSPVGKSAGNYGNSASAGSHIQVAGTELDTPVVGAE